MKWGSQTRKKFVHKWVQLTITILYFRLAPLREPPSQTDEAFILVTFTTVLFFETTGGAEK